MEKNASDNGEPQIITQITTAAPEVNSWPQEKKLHCNRHILNKRNRESALCLQ